MALFDFPRWKLTSPAAESGVVAPDERLSAGQTLVMGVQHAVAMFGATVLMQVTAPGDELVLVGVDVGGHGGLLSVGAGRHGVGRWMGPSGPIGQPSRYQTTIMAVHTRPIASE